MNSTMCTALLTLLSMTLFAGNSVLCRLALLEYKMEPVTYTAVRLISGALMLWLIMAVRHKNVFKSGTWPGALSLFTYMACFSWAYVELPTAVGTLIIAVAVQTTMIGFGFFSGERPSRQQGIGIGIALVGLVFLLLPGLTAPPFFSSLIIFISGAAWGVYCLCGKGVSDPAASTAGNFMKAVPFTLLMMLCLPSQVSFDNPGMWYALAARSAGFRQRLCDLVHGCGPVHGHRCGCCPVERSRDHRHRWCAVRQRAHYAARCPQFRGHPWRHFLCDGISKRVGLRKEGRGVFTKKNSSGPHPQKGRLVEGRAAEVPLTRFLKGYSRYGDVCFYEHNSMPSHHFPSIL